MYQEKKGRTVGSVIFSVLLSILLLAPLALTILLWEVRGIVSEAGFRHLLQELDPGRIDLAEFDPSETGTLFEVLAERINAQMEDQTVTPAALEDAVRRSSLKDFLAQEAGEFAEDLKKGTSHASVTEEELMQLIDENWSVIEPFLPGELEEQVTAAADAAAAGYMDPELGKVLKAHREAHKAAPKYEDMLDHLEKTGALRPEERDLFLDYLKNDYLPAFIRQSIAEGLPEEFGRLNTDYLRNQIPDDAAGIVNLAFSMLPVLILLGGCALLALLYFVADRHVPGDALIGIGALLMTVMSPLIVAGLIFVRSKDNWIAILRSYVSGLTSGAFAAYHLETNLIISAAGMLLVILGIIWNMLRRRTR